MFMATCLLAMTFVALACNDGDDDGRPKVPDLHLDLTPDPTTTDLPS